MKVPNTIPIVETTPFHTHDCDQCIYLGSEENTVEDLKHDYYFCNHGAAPFWDFTLINRYGSDGPDYSSGACFYGVNPAINHAGNLALKFGLITLEQLNKANRGPARSEPEIIPFNWRQEAIPS